MERSRFEYLEPFAELWRAQAEDDYLSQLRFMRRKSVAMLSIYGVRDYESLITPPVGISIGRLTTRRGPLIATVDLILKVDFGGISTKPISVLLEKGPERFRERTILFNIYQQGAQDWAGREAPMKGPNGLDTLSRLLDYMDEDLEKQKKGEDES
ncbi:hypothetical protein HY025_00430 [Candidatus Daviesbacteria bacterium]|nr:hypothetical protein [Candidatus Daviesbacteria bacterium]